MTGGGSDSVADCKYIYIYILKKPHIHRFNLKLQKQGVTRDLVGLSVGGEKQSRQQFKYIVVRLVSETISLV